jgi:hypothetical protein
MSVLAASADPFNEWVSFLHSAAVLRPFSARSGLALPFSELDVPAPRRVTVLMASRRKKQGQEVDGSAGNAEELEQAGGKAPTNDAGDGGHADGSNWNSERKTSWVIIEGALQVL